MIFGGIPEKGCRTGRSCNIACSHDTYRSITTSYDRERRVLVYFWTCDGCGAYVKELRRREYEPRYEPRYEPKGDGAHVETLS